MEVLVAVSVSVLLFFVLTQSYSLSQRIYNDNDSRAEMAQNGRVIIDRLTRELRQTPYVTTYLPETPGATTTHELMFQDGHDISQISYIRYYLDGQELNRQEIRYYFPEEPGNYVRYNDVKQDGTPATMELSEPRLVGEFVDDIELWGDDLVNINLYLSKNGQSTIINSAIYGRNL